MVSVNGMKNTEVEAADGIDPVVKLAVDAALGYYSESELMARSGFPPEVFRALMAEPQMQLAITEYRRELSGGDTPLRLRAARMLWQVMDELPSIARFAEEASDRIAAIRELAKLAGTEAAEKAAGGGGGGVTVQIVQFAGVASGGANAPTAGGNVSGGTVVDAVPVEIRTRS